MLQTLASEKKYSFLSNAMPQPKPRVFAPPVPSFSNQARLQMLQRKPDCACGGKCGDCQSKTDSRPHFIGEVDDGIPRLAPDPDPIATPMDAPDAGKKAPTCGDVCDRAYKDASLNSGGGGVLCDGSTKCACVFDVPPLKRGQCPDFDKVVTTHETRHLTDVDCDATKGLHRPPFKDPAKANASECEHRKQSITEMDALIPTAKGDCKTGMESIRGQLDTWVKANCGGGTP